MKPLASWIRIIFIFFSPNISLGQGNSSVLWDVKSEVTPHTQATLTIIAHIAPGWHVYSQFMSDDGPTPTHISFTPAEAYSLVGKTEENGMPVKFHDETYDMDVTWYEREVSFVQKIQLLKPLTLVRGRIEYLTCNDHTCVPSRHDFSIDIPPVKKTP